jgi:hypothetical protein
MKPALLDAPAERRAANPGDCFGVDRRGAVTLKVAGVVVLRPRKDLARFDPDAVVSAFVPMEA